MSKFLLLLCCITFECAGYMNDARAMTQIASKGDTLIVSSANKMKVKIKIKTHELNIGKPTDLRPSEVNSSCTYSKYPCSIVDRIDILIDSKKIFVPRSVYCDLADLKNAEIKVIEKGIALILYGGDASESYIVKIEFNTKQIMRRILSSAISPDNALQETVYHMQIIGD